MGIGMQRMIKLYRDMVLIRRFEEEVERYAQNGTIPGFIHLSIGQEAAQAGVVDCLRRSDFKFPDHRGHGAIVLCGTEPKRVMAEIFGRATGINQGRGGSMHVHDLDVGNLGFNGIQGSTQVTACGTAFASVYKGNDDVSVIFMGDGTLGEGTCHESMNMAATWNLPVVYCLLNNQYAISTHYKESHPQKELKTWAAGYEVPGYRLDGNDVEEVIRFTEQAVARARAGQGPTLLEMMTYRWQGHFSGDPAAYRPEEEVRMWKERDPIVVAQKRLTEEYCAENNQLGEVRAEVETVIEEAVEFALNSPFPVPEEGVLHNYADREVEGWPW